MSAQIREIAVAKLTSRSSFQGMSASIWGLLAPFVATACFFDGGASLLSYGIERFLSSILMRLGLERERGARSTAVISSKVAVDKSAVTKATKRT
jgi:hypothetical protein